MTITIESRYDTQDSRTGEPVSVFVGYCEATGQRARVCFWPRKGATKLPAQAIEQAVIDALGAHFQKAAQ